MKSFIFCLLYICAGCVYADEDADLKKTILLLEKRIQELEKPSSGSGSVSSASDELAVDNFLGKAIDDAKKSESSLIHYANDQSISKEKMQDIVKELEKYKQLNLQRHKDLEKLLDEE